MKRLLLFLLVASMAFAQCSESLSELELEYAEYLYIDSIQCGVQYTENLYDKLSALGEGYSYAAQCFKESSDPSKAIAYYTLAAEKYSLAADALCDSDPSLKMQLYMSSGDNHHNAGDDDLAMHNYELAMAVYQLNAVTIDTKMHSRLQQKIYELNHPMAETVYTVSENTQLDWVPITIAITVFAGIGLIILFLRK